MFFFCFCEHFCFWLPFCWRRHRQSSNNKEGRNLTCEFLEKGLRLRVAMEVGFWGLRGSWRCRQPVKLLPFVLMCLFMPTLSLMILLIWRNILHDHRNLWLSQLFPYFPLFRTFLRFFSGQRGWENFYWGLRGILVSSNYVALLELSS